MTPNPNKETPEQERYWLCHPDDGEEHLTIYSKGFIGCKEHPHESGCSISSETLRGWAATHYKAREADQDSNQLIEELISETYGERCETTDRNDFAEDHFNDPKFTRCPNCEVWEAYDNLLKSGRLALIKELEAEGPKNLNIEAYDHEEVKQFEKGLNVANNKWRTLLARKLKELE